MFASFSFCLDAGLGGILTVTMSDPYNSNGRAKTESSRLPQPRRERGCAAKPLRVATERHS
jgi:hypothetical protein